ncbi:MAG: surface lipoprotein assembly modifier, partial [Caulobacteraceae bacterium]
ALIETGRVDEARELLGKLAEAHPEDNEVQFLFGMTDIAEKDYDDAIRRFHRILVSQPEVVRVRLELGRAYFLKGDYGDAEREFLFASAGNLPPTVRANVNRYLGAIRQLKTFAYSLSFAIAPDTDLNAGPATSGITLYGIPFQLSQSARANAGVGLALQGAAEWSPKLAKHVKLRLGAQVVRSQYFHTEFDDMTVQAYAGPHVLLNKWEFDVLGNGSYRWYGDRPYAQTAGGAVDATYYATPRLGIGGAFGAYQISYPQSPVQNGPGATIMLNCFYVPDPASIVRLTGALGVQDAEISAYSSHSQQIGISWSREFAAGITLGLSPSFTHIGYDAPLAAFNATRSDDQYAMQVMVMDRKIDWGGFTPRLIYTFIRNDSSIPLYQFSRNRFEIGVTQSF